MALPGSARSELDQVEVAFNERDHAKQDDSLRAFRQRTWLKSDGPDQEIHPLGRRETLAAFRQNIQHVGLRHLYWPQSMNDERSSALFLGDDPVVAESHLGVEAIG